MRITRLVACTAALVAAVSYVQAAVPVVTNVVASQQVSSKFVDIYYDVFDDDGDTLKIRVEISDNGGNLYSVPAFSFTGDIGEGITTGANKYILWDAGTDWDGEYSDQMRVKVIAVDAQGLPGLEWGNEIPPGGFLMGQDGGAEGSGPSRHVNIPWSYWLSKYEIRNDQYAEFLNTALVAGEVRRVGTTSVKAFAGKYEGVSANDVLINMGDNRDVRWNVNNFEVAENRTNFPVRVTWYGAVAFSQHYGYDLPTEAEWEKAARGPDHDDEDEHLIYPWGDSIVNGNANFWESNDPFENDYPYTGNLNSTTPCGYYDGNQTPFGPDMRNGHGLYDVSGNVFEWTRSSWTESVETYQQEESLLEANNALTSSANRVAKGGSWDSGMRNAFVHLSAYSRRSVSRGLDHSNIGSFNNRPDMGFRVIRRDVP
jgi:sulfatase modifying factor 1